MLYKTIKKAIQDHDNLQKAHIAVKSDKENIFVPLVTFFVRFATNFRIATPHKIPYSWEAMQQSNPSRRLLRQM